MIASDVSDEDLQRSAAAHGFLVQANHITNIGLNLPQYEKFEKAVSVLETEHGGATMTMLEDSRDGPVSPVNPIRLNWSDTLHGKLV